MFHISHLFSIILTLLVFSSSVHAIFEPYCAAANADDTTLFEFPTIPDVMRAMENCHNWPADRLSIPPNLKGLPMRLPGMGKGLSSIRKFCPFPFTVSGSAILRLCPPHAGSGSQGIQYSCDELTEALDRLMGVCTGEEGSKHGRMGTWAEISDQRGYIMVGTS